MVCPLHPPPGLCWGRHCPSSPYDCPPLFSCSDLKLRVRILIDGTLIIFRVKPEDSGKYTCIPSNSLGRSPSASAYLTVQCECGQRGPIRRDGAGGLIIPSSEAAPEALSSRYDTRRLKLM